MTGSTQPRARTVVRHMAYMADPAYAMLLAACEREDQAKVAARLGVSGSTVSQVLRGSGEYGTGRAKTDKLFQRVVHKFGSYECPHLTEMYAEPRVITAAECRTYAHRATPPIGSPGLMSHWRACATCPHKALSAPAAPKPPVPRKKAPGEPASPAAEASVTTAATTTPPQEQIA